MLKASPLISIKIVSYNNAPFIGKAIQSALDQSCKDVELIIIDDCSDDASLDVIRSFTDQRITLLINERSIGKLASSKRADQACRGKYLCLLDTNDYFHIDKLAQQVAYMEQNPAADLVTTLWQEVDENGSHVGGKANRFVRPADFNKPETWIWENHLCLSSVLFNRVVHDKFWDYDSGLYRTNDWSNWIRFLANGTVFGVIPKQLTYRRVQADSHTDINSARVYWEYAFISAKVFHPFLKRIGRADLIHENLRRFFRDERYPADVREKASFLRLLLNIGHSETNFEATWKARFNGGETSSVPIPEVLVLIDEMRRESAESQARFDYLRAEMQRIERETYKIDRLRHIWRREEFFFAKLAKMAYLVAASAMPDLLKWLLRPLHSRVRKGLRTFRTGAVKAYQVQASVPSIKPRHRVVHAIANFMTGGSSRLVVDIIEHLGHVYEQDVITGFIPVPAAYRGARVHECRSSFEILRMLEKLRPDILHVHYWGDVDWAWYDKVFCAAEQLGCKIIENVNTPVAPYRNHAVERYVYVSNYVSKTFGWPDKKGVTIYPGSDLRTFSASNTTGAGMDCIGMVYRLEADKLNTQSIDVFIEVVRRRPHTRVLIVGDGSYLQTFKQAVHTHGVAECFHFAGAVSYSRLPALYEQMSIFVAPVWKESFGQVSPFAMSMGIPVVGYRVGALPEIIDDDTLLAYPGDAVQLAEIITGLLDDPARLRSIGERNRKRAHQFFSVETMIQSYECLYRDVMGATE
jgi:glycosyltransferase involved in cell wall biosynthesis